MIDVVFNGGPTGVVVRRSRQMPEFQNEFKVRMLIARSKDSFPKAMQGQGAERGTEHYLHYRFTHKVGGTYHYEYIGIDL